jgi:hypothetical protein
MKKTILCFALALAAISLHGQIYVEGKELSIEFNGKYIEIRAINEFGYKDFTIAVDYGQQKWGTLKFEQLTDAEGRVLRFKNKIAALNYFEQNGWEYLDLNNEVFYLLKRK